MFGKRSVWRSLVAGALIGVAEVTRVGRPPLRRPPGVVWLDDRDLPDPTAGIPLLLLDPVPLAAAGSSDVRRRRAGGLRVTLPTPGRLLRWLGASPGSVPQVWQAGQ